MSSTLQDSSHESDNGVVVKDSGDESDASTGETGNDSDDEPPGRRAKRQPQVEQSPVQIFTAQSRHQWATYLSLARLQVCYTPGGSLTVDEQFIPTRGRCNFRQYMTSKPGKCALKTFWCCDSNTAYPLNSEVYLGHHAGATAAANANRIRNLVKRLVHPWINTGGIITADNYFTSAELAKNLLGVQTTLVGTIRQNKKEIPRGLQPNAQRLEQSSIFSFDRQLTLVSYVPKKSHAVIPLSSFHHDQTIVDDAKKKREIILHYNDTKGGVDHMNQMVQTYSCKRTTKRWPITFFFNILDIDPLAAFLTSTTKTPQWNEKKNYRRRLFLIELGYDLIQSHLDRRRQQPHALQQTVRIAIQALGLTVTTSHPTIVSASTGKQRCHLCPRERDRKITTQLFVLCVTKHYQEKCGL
ncbi:unnamed protein product [Adineta ricciae]|uniref:PiggyBac transposable element-derived protein domain-containing protein n=1 Tax=Adineta ricciae TaxID=249248 RepID=A0A815XS15_ADIRI|nr:unnamed protein product [Adineta ricciae]